MKFDFIKKNKGPARTCFRGGFALLFSVLVASLLLTIGLSIFNIALKELAISTASSRSILAFYAADSGRECALYWDRETERIPTLLLSNLDHTASEDDIVCGGDGVDVNPVPPEASHVLDENKFSSGFEFIVSDENGGPNTIVKIDKKKNGGNECGTKGICTAVTSYGYDSEEGDRVERAIRQTY